MGKSMRVREVEFLVAFTDHTWTEETREVPPTKYNNDDSVFDKYIVDMYKEEWPKPVSGIYVMRVS